jgi:membrane fusion protein (multidrug efflux system)
MPQSLRLLLAAGLAAASLACKDKPPPAAPPPPEVKVAAVVQRDVPVYMDAIGETRGNAETEIRARVEGFIETVEFQEGMPVTKGQLLYTIDPRPFEAALAQSEASLAEAEAQLARARQDVARYEPLVAKNAIAREVYETSVAQEKAASAAVDASRAVVERTRIDRSYTQVVAPEDGLIGKTEVYPGTLVGRGQSTLLTRISRIDPIHVRMTVAERDYLELARKKGTSTGVPDPDKHAEMPFELLLADGTVHPYPGAFVFLDRSVDPRTGTILVEVAFPNPEHIVRPGQYARVRFAIEVAKGALLVPQRSVVELQGIFSVMAVGADGSVEQLMIQPAERVDSLWRIASGLKGDERVIVEGLQKVRPGVKVKVVADAPAEQGQAPPQESQSGPQKSQSAPQQSQSDPQKAAQQNAAKPKEEQPQAAQPGKKATPAYGGGR